MTTPQQPEETSDKGEEINLSHLSNEPSPRPAKVGTTKESAELFSQRPDARHDLASQKMSDQDLVNAVVTASDESLIPWESCKLPSLGMFYGWDSPFCQVRAMGQKADKILSTQRLAQRGESIDHLFQECCRFPDNFDPLDLLAGDRVFLLYYLRGITHGHLYEFAVTCMRPDCQQVSTHTYDLNDLGNTIRWADPTLGREPFRVVLPYLTEKLQREFFVELKFMRGRDMNNMISTKRLHKKLFATSAIRAGRQRQGQNPHREPTVDDTLTENLQLVITSIQGVEKDRDKIAAFVEKLHSADSAAIREWLRDNSPGIETIITLTCQECGQEFMTELPITESFFRPTKGN